MDDQLLYPTSTGLLLVHVAMQLRMLCSMFALVHQTRNAWQTDDVISQPLQSSDFLLFRQMMRS